VIYWEFEPSGFVPISKFDSGVEYLCVNDISGIPHEMITLEGHVAWSATFSTSGELLSTQAVNAKVDCPVRFQGQWADRETSLHYNRFRYYLPELRRFISLDPLGLFGGLNGFVYANNNAVGWMDPYGLDADSCRKRLPKFLRNKMKRIRNRTAAGGDQGVSGQVTAKQSRQLGEAFVGPGFTEHTINGSTTLLKSSNGLRQYRDPSPKKGINQLTQEPWSRTGVQSNFQSRSQPQGRWTSNVHLDIND